VVDCAVRNSVELELRFGLAGALDVGPAILRIGALQVGQIDVDGVGVDIDESGGVGQLSVNDGLRVTGGTGGSCLD
jgi:hypothetical protein